MSIELTEIRELLANPKQRWRAVELAAQSLLLFIDELSASNERLRAVNTDLYRELESDKREIARLNDVITQLIDDYETFMIDYQDV